MFLFKPRDAYRIDWGGPQSGVGANPPSGITVDYWLASAADSVVLEFMDSNGTVLKRISSALDSVGLADSLRVAAARDSVAALGVMPASLEEGFGRDPIAPRADPRPSAKRGMQRFTWDMHVERGVGFRGMILWSGSIAGPIVPPGSYQVRVTAGKESQVVPVTLKKDPRTAATQADLEAQYAFLVQVRDRVSDANLGVRRIRNVKGQLEERLDGGRTREEGRLGQAGGSVRREALGDRGAALSGEEPQRPGSAQLSDPVEQRDRGAHECCRPRRRRPDGAGARDLRELSARLDTELAALQTLLQGELTTLNGLLQRNGLAAVVPGIAEPLKSAAEEAAERLGEQESLRRQRRW